MKNSDISARLECAVGDLRQSEQIRERLTAENEALHQRLNAADEEIDRLRNQHQGEPVAMPPRREDIPGQDGDYNEGWNACLDEIESKRGKHAKKFGTLAVVANNFDDATYLHGSHNVRSTPDVTLIPLYTHADPGEVERLRAEAGQHKLAMDAACGEIEALRAKLAERDALLRDASKKNDLACDRAYRNGLKKGFGYGINGEEDRYSSVMESYHRSIAQALAEDALSASAEPSAPNCGNCGAGTGQACNDKGCGYLEAGNGAPVERDERAVTNAFHDWAFYKKGEAIGRMDGQQAALEGFIAGADWQARAALERKP